MGSARYVNNINYDELPNIVVSDATVQFSSSVRYLSVTISCNLSWNLHVTNVVKRIYMTLYQLKLCKNLLPQKLKQNLIVALVFPHIDYCCCVMTDITAEHNLRLHRALNACIRFIFNLRRDEHITPYYDALQWLKISDRRAYFMCCLLHQILSTNKPSTLYGKFLYRGTSVRSVRALAVDLI
ncbi:uncharacterized protein LOC109860421 [Pseudomyrmex gracilis]|uniref:uncharacterized protein LOC109860421 n=1 Tax=Pseudomyrmex gracilis TaxID=219809 RepID=UPI000995B8D1|nr:uncharacterized protein LOC109860421 [Pseudomyrmex gracilis]